MPIAHGLIPLVTVEAVNPLDEATKVLTQYSLSPQGQKLLDGTDEFCEYMSTSDITLPWGGKDAPPFTLARTNPPPGLGGGGGGWNPDFMERN
jgi:hypothetical protein